MCGICGVVSYSRGYKIEEPVINDMCRKMFHRGPDEGGYYVRNDCYPALGLGHRRLRIIDLSEAARQPMSNEDGALRIVFNGEIYNFRELRNALEDKGHIFSSHSDTEVILHLYEEEGIDCVKSLRGMFAFALWDSGAKLLLLARDRLGKKPLLYAYKNGVFCFASEFAALISAGVVSRQINREAIPAYMSFGYIPAPESIYKDIFKLQPGHILTLKDGELKTQRYWRLDYGRKINIPFPEAVKKTGELLEEAVKIRLYSDVPLGAFLSGGIDSSAVVGLMYKFMPAGKVKTFSIGFDDENFNELRYAASVARRFDTDHHEFIVRPNALEVLPELVERYGEPYADSSCIPTYYVARMTRQHVTVALNGDGGDELFAGYERYRAAYLSRWYCVLPAFLRNKYIEPLVNSIPHHSHSRNRISRIRRFIKNANLPLPGRYLQWSSFCDSDFQRRLYSREFLNAVSLDGPEKLFLPYFSGTGRLELIDILLRLDTETYLPNDLLVKVDIATMANSLEARSPFLDQRLIEFAASLKAGYKMKWLIKKYLLKQVIRGFVPRENVRRPKMGFGVPISGWFRNELKGFLTGALLSSRSLNRGYFNPGFIKAILKQHIEHKADYGHQLWSLLMLELWHNRFVDNAA